jgi:uncharacterized protein (TIGR02217 family)
MAFIEQQLDYDFNQGSSFDEGFSVEVFNTFLGREAVLRHPYPKAIFTLEFSGRIAEDQYENLIALWRKAKTVDGFRFPYLYENSSNGETGTPTSTDQLCTAIDASAGTYQLIKWYGTQGGTGVARRRIRKPRSGSVLLSIDGVTSTAFSVDTTTGIITLDTPDAGAEIKAGFLFDFPVVFQTDLSGVNMSNYNILDISIELEELYDPE